jgi:hypothetical protein
MDPSQNLLDQEIIEVIEIMNESDNDILDLSGSSSEDAETDIGSYASDTEDDDTVQTAAAVEELASLFVFGESKIENENQEEKTGHPSPAPPSAPSPVFECNVCYKALNINNVVNTTCKHKYCKKCFFRWMKSSSTCPMCRKNLISQSVWYENNDPKNELDELTLLNENIQSQLIDTVNKCHENRLDYMDLIHTNKKLRIDNAEQLRRKISLNEDINYTRGYLKALNEENNENLDKKLQENRKSYKDCPFIRGYYAGYYNRRKMCPSKFRNSFTKSEPSSDDEIMEDAESLVL